LELSAIGAHQVIQVSEREKEKKKGGGARKEKNKVKESEESSKERGESQHPWDEERECRTVSS